MNNVEITLIGLFLGSSVIANFYGIYANAKILNLWKRTSDQGLRGLEINEAHFKLRSQEIENAFEHAKEKAEAIIEKELTGLREIVIQRIMESSEVKEVMQNIVSVRKGKDEK